MNKKTKNLLLGAAATILIPAALNSLIFWNADRKKKLSTLDSHYYPWRFGKIFYTVQGQGKPLLLVHGVGAGASSFEWYKNVESLSQKYTVYTLDLLGFGRSEKPKMTYTAFLYVQLITDFIKDVIGQPTDIIGSSSSGAFSVMACYQTPSLFRRLMLICPTGIGKTAKYPTSQDHWTRKLLEMPVLGTSLYNLLGSKISCRKFLEEQVYFDPSLVTEEVVDTYYESAHTSGSAAKYAPASFITNYMNIPIESAIKTLTCPIYILWGEDTEISPVSHLKTLMEMNPAIQYMIATKSKLVPHTEHPQLFDQICTEFFAASST